MRYVLTILLFFASQSGNVFATSYPDVSDAYLVVSHIDVFEVVLRDYKSKHGKVPDLNGGLNILTVENLLPRIPVDPWGRPYRSESRNGNFKVWSLGKDGVEGGVGVDFDYSTSTLSENKRQRDMVFEKYHGSPARSFLILLVVGIMIFFIVRRIRKRDAN